MGKYLLLIAGVLILYWVVRSSLRRRDRARGSAGSKTIAEDMVRCAECGINLPRGESLVTRDRYYCCAEHQRRHDAAD